MAGPIDFTQSRPANSLQAGIVTKIRLENFMCHSSLEIELGDRVNFITGQNGSGKSAILTALCVAFGSRAKGTQRASTLKDFIKAGCSHALVHVEMKNEGEDSYKSETYGRTIIIERRLTQTTSSTVLKDCQGRKVATRKEDLREIVEHFNIDVENPCVIMSQDKSREFLHSGNDKDKFKFFFKATLLYQVDDLLRSIGNSLKYAKELVTQLEKSILPVQKELNELKGKIKSMEHVEEISQQVQILKKKLAWSWAYEVDKQLEKEAAMINKLKSRIPECQKRIDRESTKVEELKDHLSKKKAQIACLMERTSEVRKLKDELQQNLSMAMKDKLELEEEHSRKNNLIHKMEKQKKMLERQISEIHEEHAKNTQAEEHEMAEKLKDLEVEVDEAKEQRQRLIDEEAELSEILSQKREEIRRMELQIQDLEKRDREVRNSIRDLNENIRNKVTVFGGSKVINLLQSIERHHREFRKPPIGPIGVHVTLAGGDKWAYAIENALGRLLNSFIVSDHKDAITLKRCAKEANYHNVQVIIYDFSTPKLNLPTHMLPHTSHPTILSVLHSDIHTVLNVLIDMGSAERQVLVNSYEDGKSVAFDQRIPNLKEVFTIDGFKMFSRGSAQTTLPPNKSARRGGRLCGSFDGQIEKLQIESKHILEEVERSRGHKRKLEEEIHGVQDKLHTTKRRRSETERNLGSKKFLLQDLKKSLAAEANSAPPESTVDELHQEILQVVEEIEGKQLLLQKLLVRLTEAGTKASELKAKFDNLCDSGKTEIDALGEADRELTIAEDNLRIAVDAKNHYEKVMTSKVLPDITEAEKHLEELKCNKKESYRKASIICAESEIEALGGCSENNPEQLSAQLSRLTQRLEHETQRYSESVEDLRMMYAKKERKILRKLKTYQGFREKLGACEKSLELRYSKFQRNATLLKRELTWLFNGHLGKKGISGQIKVSYEEETLAVEVKMPQDASNNNVRDTRGLSGGERSFSTLCFAMALHEMTEAPFRAMDEFDVFMDAVSRKISLDTLVEFALRQGSQWIFITPHDISMVKNVEGVKKQQMAAPRS